MASYPQGYQLLASTDLDSVRRLFEGKPFVTSFDTTSQYAQGGSSACGLASLNAVRIVLDSELKGTRNVELLERLASQQFAMDVSSICSVWASDAHLELDDLYTLPLFDKSLLLVHSVYEQSSSAKLKQLLRKLRQRGKQESAKKGRRIPIGVVITRPPEIFSVFNLPTPGQRLDDVFVVFDSHPRPSKHPNGSAFLFFPTLDQTAAYLGELLHVDSTLLKGEMSWQMQLLSHYSGHFFIARQHRVYDIDSADALYDANMCILELKLSQAETKTNITEFRTRIQALESENGALRAQIKAAEKGKAVDRSSRHHSFSSVHASSCDSASASYKPATGRGRNGTYSEGTPGVPADGYHSEQASILLASRMQAGLDVSRQRETTAGLPLNSSSRTARPSSSSKSHIPSHVPTSGASHDNGDSGNASESKLASTSAEQASFLIARQMQADFSAEDSSLRAQFYDLQSSQSATFQCGICIEDYPMGDVFSVDERSHNFCRSCLKQHITVQLQQHRFPILCPMCIADKTVEPQYVTRIQAEQLGLSQEQVELWTELELAKFSLMIPCRGCKRFALVDREDHNAMDILPCPFNCGYVWCKACQQQVQHGFKHSCDGKEELKRLMKEKGYKACPGCRTPTEKTHGCNHMTCAAPHCNTHFCYRCGGNIVQSLNSAQIKSALEAHYHACALFEYPA